MIMTDIFSTLDFGLNMSMSNYIIFSPFTMLLLFILIFMMNNNFWFTPNFKTVMLHNSLFSMFNVSPLNNKRSLKGLNINLSILFLMIMILNFHGLVPYSGTTTSHLLFTLPMGLTLWFTLIISNILMSMKKFIAGFLPSGAPEWLTPFLILVDTLSIMARPITLSFRLAANISTGHVILSLMGIYISTYMFSLTLFSPLFISMKMIYMLLEIGICIIQAYIFTLLISMYANEHS